MQEKRPFSLIGMLSAECVIINQCNKINQNIIIDENGMV